MIDSTVSTYIFGVLTAIVAAFQLALAFGAPWGEMTMGGKFPGRLPLRMRVAALVQILLLAFISLIVATRAGLLLDNYSDFSTSAIWFVVVFCTLSAILNIITPSKKERMLWGPVTIVLLICSIIVATS